MGGWKTWLGGIVAVAVAIWGITWGFLNEQIALAILMAGLGALGIELVGLAHKIEKAGKKK